MSDNASNKQNRQPHQRVFIVSESYAGKRNLTDIFADILYSAYCNNESGDTGDGLTGSGYPPGQTEQTHYGDGAY